MEEQKYKIADAHAHIYPAKIALKATEAIGAFYDIGMNEIGYSNVLVESGAKIGVSKYLVCSVATSPEQVKSINDYLARKALKYTSFMPLAAMHIEFEDFKEELSRVKEMGFYGVKFHPDFQKFNIDDQKAYPIYNECAKLDLPILFHMGDNRFDYSSPQRLCNVARDIPELKCIGAHFGGYQSWKAAYNEYGKLFDEGLGKNIYFDTSSSMFALNKEKSRMLIERFGSDRFMFGSDFPMWNHEDELRRLLSLGLSEEINKKILSGNFERLFSVIV